MEVLLFYWFVIWKDVFYFPCLTHLVLFIYFMGSGGVCNLLLLLLLLVVFHQHPGQRVVATSTEKSGLIDPKGNLALQPTS